MKQTESIQQMEQCLDEVIAATKTWEAALEQFANIREAVNSLDAYLGSKEWQKDCADDRAGRLPKNLKRGVLSEDGIWNALENYREVLQRITRQ